MNSDSDVYRVKCNDETTLTTRHIATQQLMRYFVSDHLPHDQAIVSSYCTDTAWLMLGALPDSPELTAGLRKLLEAKDCFVRASL
jgi:hypothetical protein